MFKLLLKYLLALTLLGLIIAIFLYLIAAKIQERGAEESMRLMYHGGLYSLQHQLLQYPQSQWTAVIKKLQPDYGIHAFILPIADISFSEKQRKKLLAGEMLLVQGGDKYFFGYGTRDLFLYQRIGNSPYVLRMQDIPIQLVAKYASAWITDLIANEIEKTARAQWPQKLQQLQQAYGLPLSIIDLNTAPEDLQHALQQNRVALSNPDRSGQIKNIYVKVKNANAIIKIGPIHYPVYAQNYWQTLLGIFIVLILMCVVLLAYLFSRNLQKIYDITAKYSRADFSQPLVVSKHSTLHTLYRNILEMGNKIQSLLKSQHNLTRFVAHECRTPITTMLFAIEKLKHENLPEIAKKQIESIKGDLDELNQLVGDFLHYARFSTKELKLNICSVDMNSWLESIIAKFQQAPKRISLHSTIAVNTLVVFDPELMKHVLYNLINNALRHARSQIQVIAELKSPHCVIHVDDDGSAIDDADKNTIFDAFYRLNSSNAGFGLGLTIAETIVKLHTGNLLVSDSPLGGARFTVVLPENGSKSRNVGGSPAN